MLNKNKKIISIQSITDTFSGDLCVIAIIVFENKKEIDRLFALIKKENIKDVWIHEKVLKNLGEKFVEVENYKELLKCVSEFYSRHKINSIITQHYAVPRKVVFWKDMTREGLLSLDDEYDSPYPIYETAGMLAVKGEDPHSINRYNRKYNLLGENYDGYKTFHPVYDAAANGIAFINLIKTGSYTAIEMEDGVNKEKIIKELKLGDYKIIPRLVEKNVEKNLRKISTTYINQCYVSGQKFLSINMHQEDYANIRKGVLANKIAVPDTLYLVGLDEYKKVKLLEIYKDKTDIKIIN